MDFYLNDHEVAKRLLENWIDYKQIIIAFDFDNTVYDYYNKGYTYNYVISLLKEAKELGAILILSTCCDESKYKFITDYLVGVGININYINQSPDNIPFHSNKIYYNILLDDRAGLSSSYKILKSVMETMKHNPLNKTEGLKILNKLWEDKSE